MTDLVERLKPCPFCGGAPKTLMLNGATQVQCSAAFEDCAGFDILAPVDLWNRRAEDAEITRLREEVETQKEIAAVALLMHENGKARIKELEHHAKIGASCEMHGLAHVDEAGEVWTSPPPELFKERIKKLEDALVRIKFLRPAGPSRNKMVEEMERIACIALDPTEFRSRTEGEG